MSGHSKWATIHRDKGINDAKRGNLFSKLARAITIAAKTGGGGDPSSNFKLRVIIEKARQANMPKENIERAISKAAGGEAMDEVVYEGFGPGGIGVVVEAVTDNRNRTAQEIKNLFEKGGGNLAGPGAVAYNFDQKGLLVVKKDTDLDSQMLKLIDLGASDIEETDDSLEVYVSVDKLSSTRDQLEQNGFNITSFEITMKPKLSVEISDSQVVQKALGFLNSLEEHDDIQKVYANLDVPENLANELSA